MKTLLTGIYIRGCGAVFIFAPNEVVQVVQVVQREVIFHFT